MPKSSSRRLEIPVGLTCLIQLGTRVQGENHVDYRYEYYAEDNHRMTIETHSVYFEQKLMDTLIAKGKLVYDGVSGATPTGAPSASLTTVADIRRAMNLQFEGRLANHTLTPGFAYSKEHDYQSYGISLNDAIDFNDKNTILQLGVAHNFDSVRRADEVTWTGKDSTEVLVGVSQLLSPKTTLTANFTFGNDSGYLSDPYRLAQFTTFGFAFNENRPGHKNKEVVLLSLTRYLESLNASLEVSYRFHHDSFDVDSHTLGLTWHQWLGKHLMVEPMFRCYRQTAASFYAPKFAGVVPGGGYFSADYRLSELYTLDFGLQATVLITDWLKVTAGYHRYEMRGLDNLTASAMYPQANIFTAGLSFSW